jgi:hypothetical protein
MHYRADRKLSSPATYHEKAKYIGLKTRPFMDFLLRLAFLRGFFTSAIAYSTLCKASTR